MAAFNEEKCIPRKIVEEARDWVYAFNKFNRVHNSIRSIQREEMEEKKCSAMTKIYVNIGCFDDGTIAMGCVMKMQENGTFFSATKRMFVEADPTLAEALTVRWTLKLAMDLKFPNVIIHSDALTVVDCFN